MGAHSLAWGSGNVHDQHRGFQAARAIDEGRCRDVAIDLAQHVQDRDLGAIAPDADRREGQPIPGEQRLFERGDDERIAQPEGMKRRGGERTCRGQALGGELLREGLIARQALGAALTDAVHAAVSHPGEDDTITVHDQRGGTHPEGPASA